ncbi:hypothetical protein DC415_22170 [Agrobacterium tumefaciens]|uniref:Uncharacterized protein n=1 Tax=Rhizobium rhizogenes TaxID=359 RepID=A0AA92BZX4_RHIRH|nr:hypothetical protein DC430_21160 [Rhizobium rhizogenes]PVE62311.1 hypothetical protein DC415_22170 [Agrobacterium tumefaciens]PVE70494.1 hypothetical protein DCP16_22170 [Sphingomonas sp. TPD3009]
MLYPTLVLGQLGDLIDRNLLWNGGVNAETRHNKILDYLQASFERRHNAPDYDFTIVHCARDGEGLPGSFRIWKTTYKAALHDWTDEHIDIGKPVTSTVFLQLGTGDEALRREIVAWDSSPQGGTARAIFSAFCDSLEKGGDPLSGGVPQIVCLERRGGGQVIGFIADDTRYLSGLPIQPLPELDNVRWVDALFQRISPETATLLPRAQPHARVGKPSGPGFSSLIKKGLDGENKA